MPCHDTKDNAVFILDSRTITIVIVVSFLFYASYFTGITILVIKFILADTEVKKGKNI